MLFDFYTCLALVLASFLAGFIIAWFSRLFTINKIRKTVVKYKKQINVLNSNVGLMAGQLENSSIISNASQKKVIELEQEVTTLKNDNEQLKDQLGNFSFPPEKISIIKDKQDIKREVDILHRIKAKKYQVDYDRIGYASNLDKDNLKLIVGIGTFIEQKLNALGIYTFSQISNFTTDDAQLITNAIEFFPNQIEKDKWVEQAQKLVSNKTKIED